MPSFQILTVTSFFVSIFLCKMAFGDPEVISVPTRVITILLLCASIGANFWVFFTPTGKTFARKYNDDAKKQAEKQAEDFKLYNRTKSTVFSDLEGFSPEHIVFSIDNQTGIAIDEKSKNVCLLNNPVKFFGYFDIRRIQRLIIPYRDILEVAILEDGDSITKTSRTSQLAGAIIGNIMLGGAGLIIGSLTGAKRTSSRVSNLDVRLIINNTKTPVWSIAFIGSETPKKGLVYKKASEQSNNLHGLIKVLMKQADDEDKLTESQQNKPKSHVKEPIGTPTEKTVNVLELAKNGDPKAITDLLNRSLNTKGITARAKMQETTLKISLASELSPDPDRIVPFIHKGIMGLNIVSIENVEILGYRLGDSTPSWSRKLEM